MKNIIFCAAILSTVVAAIATSARADSSEVKQISPDVLKHFPAELRAKPMRSASTEKLSEGVMYLSAHFDNLFGDGPVATHWLVIDWKQAKGISLNIARRDERRECPSLLARENNALACEHARLFRFLCMTGNIIRIIVHTTGSQQAIAGSRVGRKREGYFVTLPCLQFYTVLNSCQHCALTGHGNR